MSAAAPVSAGRGEVVAPRPLGRLVRWSIPTLGNYCLLVVIVLLVAQASRFLLDSDTGWQIRAGDWILAHGRVPRVDVFSYTMAGRPWFAWEWLSDVLMSLLHRAGGLAGLVGAAIVLLAVTYGALFRVMTWRGADPFTAFVLTLLAAFASMIHWLARPHLLSIPLMLLAGTLIEAYRRTGTRWVYALPPLVAVWANLHGGFVVVVPMLVIYAVGEWLERAAAGETRSPALRGRLATYALVLALSLLAALATPYGTSLFTHLWGFAGNRELLANNLEFRSPDFHTADGRMVEWLLILAAVAAARAAAGRRYVEAGLALLWTHLTLQSERHVTLAAVVLLPFTAEHLSRGLGAVVARAAAGASPLARACAAVHAWAGRMTRVDRQATGALGYLVTLGALLAALGGGALDGRLPKGFAAGRFPVRAVDFIASERAAGRLRGHLFAHDQYGGYLIYRLYPDVQVFADGRGDMYAQGPVLDEMAAVAAVEPTWSRVLDRYTVEWMLTPRSSPLALVAPARGRWRTVYEDSTALVLARDLTRPIIARTPAASRRWR